MLKLDYVHAVMKKGTMQKLVIDLFSFNAEDIKSFFYTDSTDDIEVLKVHCRLLKEKGYTIETQKIDELLQITQLLKYVHDEGCEERFVALLEVEHDVMQALVHAPFCVLHTPHMHGYDEIKAMTIKGETGHLVLVETSLGILEYVCGK